MTKRAREATNHAATKSAATRRQHTEPDGVEAELRRFVDEHPDGWDHEQWISLVESLRERGHESHDPNGIGARLEGVRLAARVTGIPGVGSHRIRTLVDRYGSIWNVRAATADDLARSLHAPRKVAERVLDGLGV
jgi:hypothetical protein